MLRSVRALALSTAALLALAARPAAAQDKVITLWDLQTLPGAVKVIRGAADRFEASHPGFKVEDTHILNDAYKTKLEIAFGAKQPPCVFSTWGGGPLREYVKAGEVVDLAAALDADPAFRDRFLPVSFRAATVDGHVYALPAENTSIAVVFYNKDIFAKYGLTPPATWNEFMHVIDALKAKDVVPLALANKSKWPGLMYYGYLVDRIGGPKALSDASGGQGGGPGFDAPAFVEAGRQLQELVKAGAFEKGYNGLDYDIGGSRRLLYSGKAAMELMGSWEASIIRGENPGFYDKLAFFPFPSVPGGAGDPKDLLGTLGDNFVSVSSTCPYRDAAVDLVKTLTDDTAATGRLDDARVMPLKGIKPENPMAAALYKLATDAPNVQLWYDQELPPRLGEVTKDVSQALLGLSVTPEEGAQRLQAAAKAAAQ